MKSQVGARLIYQTAKDALQRAGLAPGSAVLSQSYLRFEANLIAGVTNFNLDVTVQDNLNPNFPSQQKVNLQDAFVTSEIGIFLAKTSGDQDAAFDLHTYPNQIIFPTGFNDLKTLYNSNMQLTVNNRQIFTGWDVLRHYFVPQTQDASGATIIDQNDFSQDGFYPVEPNILFIGSKKNQLQVVLPKGMATVDANTRLVVVCRGLLAQNVTPVN